MSVNVPDAVHCSRHKVFSAFRASTGNPRFGCVLSCARLHIGRRELERERAYVAQLAEHVLGKDEVSGSIPLAGSSMCRMMLEDGSALVAAHKI